MQIDDIPAPIYRTVGLPEVDDNPLIAHLPWAPETDREAFLRLAVRPSFDVAERELPNSFRRLKIMGLRRFFAPVMPVHRQAFTGICTNVFDGYLFRNPFTASGQRLLHGHRVEMASSPTFTMVAGNSGMGKSTLVTRVFDHFGAQAYRHTQFRGRPFPETQIVYLRRNVPDHCTVGNLCASFGNYADGVLGLKLYGGIFSRIRSPGQQTYLREIRKIIASHHVGALILDELQNLSLVGNGAKNIIAMLYNLKDDLSLPIIVIGTYKALRLLRSEMSAARRMVEGGYFDVERPTTASAQGWHELCSAAWDFQWVRSPVGYSEAIGQALYDVSQGITGIMLSVLMTAQVAAIEDGSETVDETLIRRVFNERMKPLHAAVEVLRSRNPSLIETFDDLYANHQADGQAAGVEGGVGQDQEANALSAGEWAEEAHDAVEGGEPGAASVNPAKATRRRLRPGEKPMSEAAEAGALSAPVQLSEEQIRKIVTSNSHFDLLAETEGR